MTRIDRRGINKHMSYSVKELCDILDVDEKTIQRWMENGLKPIAEHKKPLLFHGSEVKEFLKNKDAKKKVPLKRGEFYCLSCKAARRAKRGSIVVLEGRKTAMCSVCSGKMSRIFKPYRNDYKITLFPT
jgi:transposase-like protein